MAPWAVKPLLMMVGVYGFVGVIAKLDELGAWLTLPGAMAIFPFAYPEK